MLTTGALILYVCSAGYSMYVNSNAGCGGTGMSICIRTPWWLYSISFFAGAITTALIGAQLFKPQYTQTILRRLVSLVVTLALGYLAAALGFILVFFGMITIWKIAPPITYLQPQTFSADSSDNLDNKFHDIIVPDTVRDISPSTLPPNENVAIEARVKGSLFNNTHTYLAVFDPDTRLYVNIQPPNESITTSVLVDTLNAPSAEDFVAVQAQIKIPIGYHGKKLELRFSSSRLDPRFSGTYGFAPIFVAGIAQ